jgi:hypothetical protein
VDSSFWDGFGLGWDSFGHDGWLWWVESDAETGGRVDGEIIVPAGLCSPESGWFCEGACWP